MMDINLDQNLLDLFIFYKSWLGICMYEGPRLAFLGRDMLLTLPYQTLLRSSKL